MLLQCLSYNLRPRSINLQWFFSCWATIYDPGQPIRNVLYMYVVELRSKPIRYDFWSGWAPIYDPGQPIRIFVQCLNYDLRPRSTNSQCFLTGWAMIYDPDQPIRNVFLVVELRPTTQVSQFTMFFKRLNYDPRPRSTNLQCFFSCWATTYDLDQPIRNVFQVVELRSTTQMNQFAMFSKWLSYDLRPMSANSQCFSIGWATIYDPDQPISNVF